MAGVGVFVMGGLLLFAGGLFMIGDRQMAFAKKVTLYTEFRKITGLQPGAVVRVSGAKAGSITQILPPDTPSGKFRVEVEIVEDLHQLVRTDSLATIETEGLVGGNYLGITTGSDTAPIVAPNTVIAGKEPIDIAELVQRMGDTVTKVNDAVDDMSDDVQRAVVAIADTAENANVLITGVTGEVTKIAASGALISADAAQIADGIRSGKGTIGKLLNDDELYNRVSTIAKQTEETTAYARQLVQSAKETLEGLQSKDGSIQGMTASVKQTMDGARAAMTGLAENMDAMKHNFLLRGYFNKRGYYDLDAISPAEYRTGVLENGKRKAMRIWLKSALLFEPGPDGTEVLSESGRARIDSAMSTYLKYLPASPLVVEGYAPAQTVAERFRLSRRRAGIVRQYIVGKYEVPPQNTGFIGLGIEALNSPDKGRWDGVSLTLFLDRTELQLANEANAKSQVQGPKPQTN
jgi:phospholipid/cholesterol/gamma-HCH transport system substrate-binding protein